MSKKPVLVVVVVAAAVAVVVVVVVVAVAVVVVAAVDNLNCSSNKTKIDENNLIDTQQKTNTYKQLRTFSLNPEL